MDFGGQSSIVEAYAIPALDVGIKIAISPTEISELREVLNYFDSTNSPGETSE